VKNLALNKPVTASDKDPIIGKLDQVTDGDKEGSDGSWVELGAGFQWVQIDLGKTAIFMEFYCGTCTAIRGFIAMWWCRWRMMRISSMG
jgi:hypothetical protein